MAAADRVEKASGQRGPRRALVTWIDAARLMAVVFGSVILYADFADPGVMDSSDYVSSFYVAGHLAAAGEFDRLYPKPEAVSFRDSPFNQTAHELLPRLGQRATTNFMYPPVVAWLFAPLSVLPTHISLLVWQVLSVGALGLACLLLSRTSDVRWHDLFFLSLLFFPVFITVVIGQAGLLFGLLPLSIGYWLLSRGSPFAAGFVWAALALKPTFLPAAGLMAMAYAVIGRIRLLTGMILGLGVWLVMNIVLVPPGAFTAWMQSLRISDSIFSRDDYQVPVHLLASIPADVMMRVPLEARASVKPVLYGLAAALGLFAVWQCRQILRSQLPQEVGRLAVFAACVAILPLTSPHLLYYDLVTLFPMGIILLSRQWSEPPLAALRRLVLVSWVAIGAYLVFFSFVGRFSPTSLILLAILLAAWMLFLHRAVAVSRMPAASADNRG